MVKYRTLELKVTACIHCKNADRAKLRQHRPNYCDKFEARNGHCANFEERK